MAENKNKTLYPFELGKLPPQAVEIEEAILGILLSESEKNIDFVFSLLKPEIFYKENNQKIYKSIVTLKDNNKPYDLLSVIEQLKKDDCLDEIGGPYYVAQLNDKIKTSHSLKHYCLIIIEKYILREIIQVCNIFMNKSFESKVDIFEILDEIKFEIERIEAITNINNVNARDALKDAVNYIDDIAEGKRIPYLKSGIKKFDIAYSINTNQIVVFAAQKGHLKTRTLVKIVRGWIEHNDNIAVLWYSMEEPASKMSRLSICHSTGIDDLRMLGKKSPKLSNEERQQIAQVSEEMWNDDIQYKETGSTIQSIKNNFISFCKKRPDKKNILVIDNYGRTKSGVKFKNSNDEDDYIANQYVDIRDATKGLIFIVHHLNKSQLSKINIESGYRPREEEVRGSSRIIDYCNTLILGNFIAKHKDLIQLEKDKNIKPPKIIHEPFPMCYTDLFLSINNEPDKNNKDATVYQFKQALNNTINYEMAPLVLKKHFPDLSYHQAVELVFKRYFNYYIDMSQINNERNKTYRTVIDDPLTYLKKSRHLKEYVIDKEKKEYYLYGDNIDTINPIIKNLLILDAPKVRDGEPDDDIVLVRFYVHPGKMIYKEL